MGRKVVYSLARERHLDTMPAHIPRTNRAQIRNFEYAMDLKDVDRTLQLGSELAEDFYEMGDFDKALMYATRAIEFAESQRTEKREGWMLVAKSYSSLEDFEAAILHLKLVLSKLQSSKEKNSATWRFDANFELALTFLRRGESNESLQDDFKNAQNLFENLLQSSRSSLTKKQRCDIFMNIGITSRYNLDYSYSIDCLEKALKLAYDLGKGFLGALASVKT
ncbi:hypothetical protein HDU97_001811 [Phlyctochytrium planicorne]|nr:hypothetical protein HDU97_001811 [Phlyctochytrium planicorne]